MDRTERECLAAMHNATDYASWREPAAELDRRQGADAWREDDASEDYDWRLIRSRVRQMRQYREEGADAKLIHHLRQGLHWNLGNIGNSQLYTYTRLGTKRLITDYIRDVCEALEYVAALPEEKFPYPQKLKFFQEVTLSYGRSALMLSGGATLGLFHVGVVRTLFREGLLPTVLSGSSAGSIVASVVGTRSPADTESLLDPESAYYHFWKLLPLREMIRRGAIADQSQLLKAISANVLDLTFEEAHKLSGRVINITVSPAGTNQPPKLLNHLTFPFLYVREAVLASCAVPIVFPPVLLMTQNELGERSPYMPLLRWNDGSLKSDLPMLRLRRLHNVNHFIVSQTNPHVLPFVSRREKQDSFAHTTRDAVSSTTRTVASGVMKLARAAMPFAGLRQPLDTALGLLDQDYRGNVNIVPEVSLWRYANVTANPTIESVKRFMLEGERSTWPRIEMIRTQTMISSTLERCLTELEHGTVPAGTAKMAARSRLRVVRNRDSG